MNYPPVSKKEKASDPEYTLFGSSITRGQLVEGLVMALVFPLLALVFRKFPYYKKNYIGHFVMYGIPVGLTWLSRKYTMSWYNNNYLQT
jgi:hypothetical protein